jgi:hypothetical protein
MKRSITILAVMLLVAVCVVGCGGGGNTQSDNAAIESTINAYIAAYNAQDYQSCLNYLTGWTDQEATIWILQLAHASSGNLTIQSIDNIVVSGLTATASVSTTYGNESNTETDNFKNDGGIWKIVIQ